MMMKKFLGSETIKILVCYWCVDFVIKFKDSFQHWYSRLCFWVHFLQNGNLYISFCICKNVYQKKVKIMSKIEHNLIS